MHNFFVEDRTTRTPPPTLPAPTPVLVRPPTPPKRFTELCRAGWDDLRTMRAGLDLSTMLQRGRRLEPEALKSGHARGPTPLGARPSFRYEGGGVKPLTRLAPQHPAPNAAPEGHQFSGTIFIAKNALFPTEFGLLDAFFGCPMGGPKNDPGEHHRLSFSTLAKYALLMFFGWHWRLKGPPQERAS